MGSRSPRDCSRNHGAEGCFVLITCTTRGNSLVLCNNILFVIVVTVIHKAI